MAKTVIGLFDSFAEAQEAVEALLDDNFRREDISVFANDAAHDIPYAHAEAYAEGVRRGGTLVVVSADEARAGWAAQVMEQYNVVDIERRSAEWQQAGPAGDSAHAGEEGHEPLRQTARRSLVDVSLTDADAPGYDKDASDSNDHTRATHGDSGYSDDDYRPAYNYAALLATSERYHGLEWEQIEADVRDGWEQANPGTWEDFKATIYYAWELATGRRSHYDAPSPDGPASPQEAQVPEA